MRSKPGAVRRRSNGIMAHLRMLSGAAQAWELLGDDAGARGHGTRRDSKCCGIPRKRHAAILARFTRQRALLIPKQLRSESWARARSLLASLCLSKSCSWLRDRTLEVNSRHSLRCCSDGKKAEPER